MRSASGPWIAITMNQGIARRRQTIVIRPVPFRSDNQPASGPAATPQIIHELVAIHTSGLTKERWHARGNVNKAHFEGGHPVRTLEPQRKRRLLCRVGDPEITLVKLRQGKSIKGMAYP